MQVAYFDNAASTKVDPEVLDAMMPFLTECYANPSALHSMAFRAKAAIEEARRTLAELIGADDPAEIIFTSGATEANDTVLNTFGGRMLVSDIEHPSVRNPALESGRADLIPVDQQGTLDFEAYERLLESPTELVSVMSVNNEIGAVQDIDKIGEMAHRAGALFHSDITQGVGKHKLEVQNRPTDYATLSGHKFHAPKGIGMLWVRNGCPLKRFMVGGLQEGGRRSGTLNVAGIVGLGAAAKIAMRQGAVEIEKMARQRQRIIDAIVATVPDVRVNGQPDGAPHIINLSLYRTEGEAVIINLDSHGICCTAGAACASGSGLGSHVLNAIGLPQEWLKGSVRISLSRLTTDAEVDYLIQEFPRAVSEVRGLAGYAAG
ncbi:cysteine desulfurase [Fimbriimonadia bacterium ATM]|nr:MAG: cysteine desulfurase [Armatimonadota bacterium]MBC6970359.1 cysteine desulfurase [Armatimonadota bacterium]MCE7899764.1 cysteine desulfurase [Armatimonadetes bacterium ATM1]MDL1929036.1 cysteine desulfurase [Fimbriimonadia bacterium ATM]RIJ95893.1 MAG: cysteine desulfurase NifS [Armatimonadota bacterium]